MKTVLNQTTKKWKAVNLQSALIMRKAKEEFKAPVVVEFTPNREEVRKEELKKQKLRLEEIDKNKAEAELKRLADNKKDKERSALAKLKRSKQPRKLWLKKWLKGKR